MSSYENDRKRLQEVEKKLQSLIQEADARQKAFHRMTLECRQRIAQCYQICQQRDAPLIVLQKGLKHYVKQWFRSFLGVRDECMILINGELVRNYHIPTHEAHTHARTKESYYYNSKCTLSMCSIDGVDYEYRQLVEKFGNRSVSTLLLLLLLWNELISHSHHFCTCPV